MSDRLVELDVEIEREESILAEVLDVIRTAEKGKCRSLRNSIALAVSEHFEFWRYKCSICGEWKKVSDFPSDRTRNKVPGAYGAVGRRGECKICHADKRNDAYWKDPEHYRKVRRDHDRRKRTTTRRKGVGPRSRVSRRIAGEANYQCGKMDVSGPISGDVNGKQC
jgi:hypothetical protein